MTDQKTAPVHTVEVAMQSKAWWYWRCTCTNWGSGFRSDTAARKAATEHRHFDLTSVRRSA